MPVIHWIAEVGKWQAFGRGCVGLGDTPNEALQNWREDVRRTELERVSRLDTNTGESE